MRAKAQALITLAELYSHRSFYEGGRAPRSYLTRVGLFAILLAPSHILISCGVPLLSLTRD